MKVLVVGDIHLKPWIINRVEELLEKYKIIQKVVFLGDFVDDWSKQYSLEAYYQTMDRMIDFVKCHPKTIVIIGNHDISYEWRRKETGYSLIATKLVIDKYNELRMSLPVDNQPAFIAQIDNCIFCHGGLSDDFIYNLIKDYSLPEDSYNDTNRLIEIINTMDSDELWNDESPLWYRPQYYKGKMYKGDESGFLQVVGHTPVEKVYQDGNILSCDVFSTDRDGITPIGSEEFVLLDTVSLKWKCIK